MRDLRPIDVTALVLLVIGGLNWGMVGLFDMDLVAMTAGRLGLIFSRVIYVLVGMAAIWTAGRSPYMARISDYCKCHITHPAK